MKVFVYFTAGHNYGFIVGISGLIISFFAIDQTKETLTIMENGLMLAILALMNAYFFYAQYEGKQYKHCTSCQIGNIVGTVTILSFKLLLLFLANYFILY